MSSYEIIVNPPAQYTIEYSNQRGPQGAAGVGVPAGGTAGQVLAKINSTDYNTEWVTGGGGGGDVAIEDVTGLGTGVATAIAVNVGSAGAVIVNGGDLGTPSGGIVTNLTGTASININGTVGATTQNTGAFSTVAIGISTASVSLHLSGTATTQFIDRYSDDTTAPAIVTRKARGTVASPTSTLSGDVLGSFGSRGYHALGGFVSGASANINIVAAQNFDTPFGVGSHVVFETVAVGSSSRLERMRLNASGGLSIGTTTDAGSTNLLVAGSASANSVVVTNGTTLGVRTIATLPVAATASGQSFRVSDSPVFANRIATSDGTVWHYEGLAKEVGVNPDAGVVGAFSFKIDTQATGAKSLFFRVPYACTITGWELVADASGSVVIDIWKDTYANFPPVNADSITASAKPTISTAVKANSTTLTGWTTSLAAGDYIEVEVESVTTITNVTLTLNVVRT
jgi:hypothetical protein